MSHSQNKPKQPSLTKLFENLTVQHGAAALEPTPTPRSLANVNPTDDGEEDNLTMREFFKRKNTYEPAEDAAALGAAGSAQGSRPGAPYPQRLNNYDAFSRKRKAIEEFRKSLPIYPYKQIFLDTLAKNNVVVIQGETGSGKSTQITQYLLEAGYANTKKIGCTQPRRVAAVALAKRVAYEVGTTVGDRVGFRVRFENQTCGSTLVKYITDGMLLAELACDPNLDEYSIVMLDEAHERSVNTDVSMGLLKRLIKQRSDLKLIVTSATLDSKKFSEFFDHAPVLSIPGRTFPVDIIYTQKVVGDYYALTIDTVMRIHDREPEGDILVFLTGQDEIESMIDGLYQCLKDLQSKSSRRVEGMIVLPFYSSLSWDQLNQIYEPVAPGARKVILATNIAETSLTIDGVVYVVDSGYVKEKSYHPKTGIDTLVVKQISQAQAIQRSGRAGRTKPGKVYRLYPETTYKKMPKNPIPEIRRCNMDAITLQLIAMGVQDVLRFPFMDTPETDTVLSSFENLMDLEILSSPTRSTKTFEITEDGRHIAKFPLDPTLAKVLLMSSKLHCSEEILTIVSMLSTQNQQIFIRPKKRRVEADAKAMTFYHPLGDHLTFLNVYNSWIDNGKSKNWCRENYIQFKALEEACEIRKQLKDVMKEHKLPIESCGGDVDQVRQTLCTGFFRKIARKENKGFGYTIFGKHSDEVFIFPSSSLFKIKPRWMIFNEVVQTKKTYLRIATTIEPMWIRTYCPTFFFKLIKEFPELKVFK